MGLFRQRNVVLQWCSAYITSQQLYDDHDHHSTLVQRAQIRLCGAQECLHPICGVPGMALPLIFTTGCASYGFHAYCEDDATPSVSTYTDPECFSGTANCQNCLLMRLPQNVCVCYSIVQVGK